MKTKKLHIIFVVMFTIYATSCNDFLNIQPKGILIPRTVAEYETLLNGHSIISGSDSYPAFITDDVFMPDMAENNTPGLNNLNPAFKNLYVFKKEVFDESQDDNLWYGAYARIYYYNIVANDILNATGGTLQQKECLRAEALTGRALEYLTLVNAYATHYDPKTAATDAGVPLLLKADINENNLTRASVQVVYDRVVADLTEAVKSLPDKPHLNAWRASKPAAWGLLSRAYLYMGNYAEALKYANMALEKTNTLLDLKKYKVVAPEQRAGRINVPEQTKNPENIYIRMDGNQLGLSGRVFGSDDLLTYFSPKDQRFTLYFSKTPEGIPSKYYFWVPYLLTNTGVFTPELYLTAAECEARIGSTERAMQLVNAVRDNRLFDNTPLTAISPKDALVKVLNERRRELAFVGCRRLFDLKRLNKDPELAKTIIRTAEGKTLTLSLNSPLYVLPIPTKVLRFNPDMKPNER